MAPQRENQFKILLSDEELRMLRELAEDDGLTASDYVRTMVRRQHSERVEPAPKRPKPKRSK